MAVTVPLVVVVWVALVKGLSKMQERNSNPIVPIELEKARTYIEQMNLDYIIEAMCSTAYALPRWTIEDAKHCASLYKNFLFLQKKHLPESLVPTREIDEFWHNHILYTKKYFHDCMNIFGHYLHHQPASPTEDPRILIEQYHKTKEFYLDEFKCPLGILNETLRTAK